jgi:hypothetical protein
MERRRVYLLKRFRVNAFSISFHLLKLHFHFHLWLHSSINVALKYARTFELLVSEPGVDAPIANHFRVDRISGLLHGNLEDSSDGRFRRRFFRDFGELSVVADESGDDDGDHGHQGEEDEESREPGHRKADTVHNLLAHSTLKNFIIFN